MTTCTGRQRKLGVFLCFVRPRLMFFGHWLSSANSEIHLVSSDASHVTIPVEDIETFDPSRPSLSSEDSILLLKGKNLGYPDVAPKALSLCADSHLFHHVCFLSFRPPIQLISPGEKLFSFHRARLYCFPNIFPSDQSPPTRKYKKL